MMNSLVNKKMLIIISIIIVVGILTAFLGFKTLPSEKVTHDNSKTSKNISSNAVPTNPLITYHTASYSLSYPSTWSKKEINLTRNGGTLVIFQFQPANSIQSVNVSIEVLNAQTNSISTLTHIYTALHYTETNSSVARVRALKYTAVLPTQNGNLHSIDYIFEQNEKIYSVKLEYIQADANTNIEGQFHQLLNSFSIQ